MDWKKFIQRALKEDIREGDFTSLSCIRSDATGSAKLHIKDHGILAGIQLAEEVYYHIDPSIQFKKYLNDGDEIHSGQIAFEVTGSARNILAGERLVLNCMQRMSGIATLTKAFVMKVEGTNATILDTRKTTPLFRAAEKWAVKIGGGANHRFGLFDMILIKDNHIDYAGGVVNAIEAVSKYLKENKMKLRVEIEARNIEDVNQIIKAGMVDRIMLDNFSIELLHRAVALIDNKFETEASGGVTLETVRDIAITGVDFISVGALTHSYRSLDLSLKAAIN